jgi:hypothetical protein
LALLQAEAAQERRTTAAAEQATEETSSVDGRGVSVGTVVFEEADDLFEEVGDDGKGTGDVLLVGGVLVDDIALLGLIISSLACRGLTRRTA